MFIDINYFAVFLAAVASMGVGFFWYSPMFLGKPWMKERGMTPTSLKKAQKQMGRLYGLSFLVSLITACVLAHAIYIYQVFYISSPLTAGFLTAFWMWLGFVLPVQITATLFGNQNWKLLTIDTGYQLAAVLTMGIVLGLL